MVELHDIKLGLDSISCVCELLGNPQDKFKTIHITGTNGKGSVGAFLESILMEAGYKVGRFTSPAVESPYETISVNGVNITPEDYAYHQEKVENLIKDVLAKGVRPPSPFEVETAMAFDYLSTRCDIALIEVGMGGRLDATNVIDNKILHVITSISLDHTQFLGETIEEITSEKCGIIKYDVPTVTVLQNLKALGVIADVCREQNSRLWVANTMELRNVEMLPDYSMLFDYYHYHNTFHIKMLGTFQLDNAILAIQASEVLGIPYDCIRKGLTNAVWKYRFEVVSTKPVLILDGCHNEGASVRVRDTMGKYFKGKPKCYIMGMFKDKDYKTMVKNLCQYQGIDKVYTVSTKGDRSLSAEELAVEVRKYVSEENVIPCSTMKKLVRHGLSKTNRKHLTLALGSLSFLSEFKQLALTKFAEDEEKEKAKAKERQKEKED